MALSTHHDFPATELDFGSKISDLQVLPYSGRLLVKQSQEKKFDVTPTSYKSRFDSHLKWLDPDTLRCIDEYYSEENLYGLVELPNKQVICDTGNQRMTLTLDCDEAENPGLAAMPHKTPPLYFLAFWKIIHVFHEGFRENCCD